MASSNILVAELLRRYPYLGEPLTAEEAAAIEAEKKAEKAEEDKKRRNRRLGNLLRPAGRRYWRCTLESFIVSEPGQQAVVDALIEYRRKLPENVGAGMGIVLFGPTGTGKDHLLIGLGRVAAQVYDLTVEWLYGAQLASCPFERMDSQVSRYAWASVLILSDPVADRMRLLERIIHARDRNGRATWASMNVRKGDEADAQLGAALTDRLRDGALTAFCGWRSFRKPAITLKTTEREEEDS